MKGLHRFFLTYVFITLSVCGIAQNLSTRTNEISIRPLRENYLLATSTLPVIRWIHPDVEFSSSASGKMDLRATVSLTTPVKQIKLVVGDADRNITWTTKNIVMVKDQLFYDIKLPITIPEGNNFVELEVTTNENITISEKRKVLIGKGSLDNVLSLDRKDYALLIATDKYDYWTDLVNPIDDAHAIAKELKEKYGFLVDVLENPNVEDIWTKLREYNEKRFGPQDQLFVFFAGHGHFDETFGEGYVVAKNSLENDLGRNSYISHNRLRGVIGNIQCPHILLTMDVCFGGTLDPVIARNRGSKQVNEVSVGEMLARKWNSKTRKYLTSGGKEYVSDGIQGKHSPFSEKFIESLRSMGGSDMVLTLGEIQVELEKLKQLPRTGSFGDDESMSDFIFVGKRKN